MSINLSSLANVTTSATALSNLILATPQANSGYQPQNSPTKNGTNAQPPKSILFHYEGEQTFTLDSDVTDHVIEDNTTLQDQIALKPEVVTTHGFIGELNDVPPAALALLKTAADKLTIIGAYTPALSVTAINAYNEAAFLYSTASNTANAAVSAWSSLTGGGSSPNQTKQQLYFNLFYGYWQSRTLFTIQTPWAIMTDMVLKTVRAIQSEETNVITDFEVTFKKLRFATTQVSLALGSPLTGANGLPTILQGRSANQGSSPVDLGTSTPPAGPSLGSLLSTIG